MPRRPQVRRPESIVRGDVPMKTISIIRETIASFGRDRGTLLAASIAYYTLLSIFPMILGLLAIAGVIFDDPATRERFVTGVASLFPGSESLIVSTIDDVVSGRGSAGLVATLGLLWSASGVFSTVAVALNTIWRVPSERNPIASAVLAVALVFGVGLIFGLSLLLSTALAIVANLRVPLLGVSLADVPLLIALFGLALPLLMTFAVFAFIYRFIPNRWLGWSVVWPGAVLASFLFEVGKQVFVWYLSSVAHLNAVYGSIGAVIAMVVWSYYAAIILLIGAEFNATLAR
jgi:membrane protein